MIKVQAEQMAREAQRAICAAVSELEGREPIRDQWERSEGGGGTSRVLQGGEVFGKAGANVSVVHGPLTPSMLQALELSPSLVDSGEEMSFFATGVSTVLHPNNPYAPTAHANYRYFEVHRGSDSSAWRSEDALAWWFGGGADLTPIYLFEEDAVSFHRIHREACDRFDGTFYGRFKRWCDAYFHLPHRQEARGIGGIFFDRLADRDPKELLAFCSAAATAFVEAYFPIVARHKDRPYGEAERHWQRLRRGRYVEFNLLYDRGTSFGLRSGGRTESILMSLPLEASWEYCHEPAAGSPESVLLQAVRTPRDWLG